MPAWFPPRARLVRLLRSEVLAAWLCLVAIAAQFALPFAHGATHETCNGDPFDFSAGSSVASSARSDRSDGQRRGHDESTCPACRTLATTRAIVVPPPAPVVARAMRCEDDVIVRLPVARASHRVRSWSARAPPGCA